VADLVSKDVLQYDLITELSLKATLRAHDQEADLVSKDVLQYDLITELCLKATLRAHDQEGVCVCGGEGDTTSKQGG
jgi:hypothetical protein